MTAKQTPPTPQAPTRSALARPYGSALRTAIVRVMLVTVFVPIDGYHLARETVRCLSNLGGFWVTAWRSDCREFRMCWRAEFKPIDPFARCQREPNEKLSDARGAHSLKRMVGLPPKTTENPNKTGQK